jgi:hypothetical protein
MVTATLSATPDTSLPSPSDSITRQDDAFDTSFIDDHGNATVGIATAIFGTMLKEPYDRAFKLQKSYAALHGYSMNSIDHNIFPGIWTKLAHILALVLEQPERPMDERLHWIL